MKRIGIALIGFAVGGGLGWLVVFLIFPYDAIAISTAGAEEHANAFNFLGVAVGGALGFVSAGFAAMHWVHVDGYDSKRPPIVVDPRKVEDHLG
jgi:hypothetical protein